MNDQDIRSEKDPEEIEEEIDGTRSSITQKLEALEEKVRVADYVIDTSGTKEHTLEQVTSVYKSLRSLSA